MKQAHTIQLSGRQPSMQATVTFGERTVETPWYCDDSLATDPIPNSFSLFPSFCKILVLSLLLKNLGIQHLPQLSSPHTVRWHFRNYSFPGFQESYLISSVYLFIFFHIDVTGWLCSYQASIPGPIKCDEEVESCGMEPNWADSPGPWQGKDSAREGCR